MSRSTLSTLILRTAVAALLVSAPCLLDAEAVAQDRPPDQTGQRGTRGQDRGNRGERGVRGQERGNRGERGVRGQDRGNRGDRGRGGGGFRGGRGGRGGMIGGMGRMGGMGMFTRMMEPDFLRRDLTLFIEHLELDEMQATIVESLLLDYEAAFAEASESARDEIAGLWPGAENREENREQRRGLGQEMRDLIGELRGAREQIGDDPEAGRRALAELEGRLDKLRERMRELRPPMPDEDELNRILEEGRQLSRKWKSLRKAMKTEFLAGLRAILAEDQMEMWPPFERTLRRVKTLGRGELSGEEIDLFLLVRKLGIGTDDLELLADALEAYAVALDRALVERNDFLDESRDMFMQLMREGNLESALALSMDEARLREAVRGVNERHRDELAFQLAEQFDEAEAKELRTAYRNEAFERIFSRTSMQRAFEVALGMEELDDDTLMAILALEDAYLDELSRRNVMLVEISRREEPLRNKRRLERWAARMSGEERTTQTEDPIREAFAEREDLDRRYRAQLESLLTPEQIELLPPPPRERRGRGEGRGGDRGGRGNRGGDDAGREARWAEMMKRFDTNGDGELSSEERQAAREAMRRDGGGRGGRGGGNGG